MANFQDAFAAVSFIVRHKTDLLAFILYNKAVCMKVFKASVS